MADYLKRVDDEVRYAHALKFDFQFRRKLIEMSKNPLMQNVMELIYEFVVVQMARTNPSQRLNHLGRRRHKANVRSVLERDPDTAEK